jgi:hypothetical protein
MRRIDWVATLVAFIAAGTAGCASRQAEPKPAETGQSFEEAMSLVCNVDQHVQVADADLLEREQLRNDYLQDHVKNPDVIYHRTLWRVQATKERAKTIRELAGQCSLAKCAYADTLEAEDL